MRCPRPLILACVAAVVAVSLLAAGCGGGGSPSGVASIASSTTSAMTTTTPNALVAYSRCMRTNGVPGFPDPDSSGGIAKTEIRAAVERNPNKFTTAETACRRLFPANGLGPQQTAQQQRTLRADGLSFARCMRSHGVSRFPDPTAQGQLTAAMGRAAGIDLHSPAVLQAVQACLPASHGAITPAKVREALNHAGG